MSKRTSRTRKLKRKLRGEDKELYDILQTFAADREGDPTAEDAQRATFEMYELVLKRMVEIRIAQYLNNAMTILRDMFGFDEKQLTKFARELRRQTRVSQQAKADVEDANGS